MSEQPETDAQTPGLIETIKRMGRTVLATVHNRAELLALEFQEEGIRLVGALLLAGSILLFSGLALIMGMFTVVLAVDSEHRVMAALVMTVILMCMAVGTALWLWSRLKNWSAFAGTRAELRKDKEWLQSNRS